MDAKEYTLEATTSAKGQEIPDRKIHEDLVLVPQPSNDPKDPLNWPLRRKIVIFTCICFAGFAGQHAPNSNQLTYTLQVPTYRKTQADLLNSVAASLAGWMAGPFIFAPWAAVLGRSSVIFWSLVGAFGCQIWAATMVGIDDFIPFTISRLICGLFGVVPAILGPSYTIDMFFLHQRGKAIAIFEVVIIFAVVGGGTIGGFIAEHRPWPYVFWWTLGPLGAAIITVFCFVEDTTYDRKAHSSGLASRLPSSWLQTRITTFLPGHRTQPNGKAEELKRRFLVPFVITFTPITLLIGTFVFVALGLPIMQASTLAIYLQSPVEMGGYAFSPLQTAFFTMTAWVGMGAAQIYGVLFNDKTPLWVARRTGGTWHTEYRLANAIVPGLLLPIGLGLWGAGIQYHLHFMVLALASFIIWFAALLVLPVCYNYIIECFLDSPVEAAVSLNAYRISFGLASLFFVLQWQTKVGVGWMWGMSAFFTIFVDIIMFAIISKGHLIRKWSISENIAVTEDGVKIAANREDIF